MTLERWLRLMAAWSFPQRQDIFDLLLAAYAEKWRHYHTAEHVSACLRHFDAAASELAEPREVEIALWFHDAVYKPLSSHNEKKSADLAVAFMLECGADSHAIARVHRLIMATRHCALTQTNDEAALLDIDLSILGTPPSIYARYEQHVRSEYRMVPAFVYRKKRVAILRGFLDRPKIYSSGLLPDELECQARINLQNAVTMLEGHGTRLNSASRNRAM